MLARNQNPAQGLRRKLGLTRPHLVAIEPDHIGHSVTVRLIDDGIQLGQFLVGPGDHQRGSLQERQIQSVADFQIFAVAGPHAGQLQAAGWRVEAGMQQGAVRLAGPGQDVGGPFEQDDAGSFQREAAGNRATNHPTADDGDIERAVISGWPLTAHQGSVLRLSDNHHA